ncbi:hypothetical protein QR680_015510 [Steinernema hermaphroditum]|uniref:Uncharacterized protein n=1 Tax=Steinernema hermaphroditum TaxID=289476 RepID=A0AA39H903_9BILA|nr:hypothetical protein QR680_015510 [Steinernema hermaphroditum]
MDKEMQRQERRKRREQEKVRLRNEERIADIIEAEADSTLSDSELAGGIATSAELPHIVGSTMHFANSQQLPMTRFIGAANAIRNRGFVEVELRLAGIRSSSCKNTIIHRRLNSVKQIASAPKSNKEHERNVKLRELL